MARLEIGVLIALVDDMDEQLGHLTGLGLRHGQICSWQPDRWTPQTAESLHAAIRRAGVKVTTFWSGLPGPHVWNFQEGPNTVGLVPDAYRAERVEILKQAADFAVGMGFPSITTHVGFLPEDPNDARFAATVEAVRTVALYCRQRGLEFWFETGQETPVTLLRTLERVGTDNLGVNFDTANVILYGKANPVDALDVVGRYVRDVHAKDGFYPTNGHELGRECPLGEGKVDFPAFVRKLKSLGYAGTLTIEREIGGEQQRLDIQKAVDLLRPLC
jgi:sugar phosphate isomerase/epimerase